MGRIGVARLITTPRRLSKLNARSVGKGPRRHPRGGNGKDPDNTDLWF